VLATDEGKGFKGNYKQLTSGPESKNKACMQATYSLTAQFAPQQRFGRLSCEGVS
jgi:hypothetical protein